MSAMPDSNPTIQIKTQKTGCKDYQRQSRATDLAGADKIASPSQPKTDEATYLPHHKAQASSQGKPITPPAPNHTERMDTEYACNPPPRPTSEEGEGENPGRRG